MDFYDEHSHYIFFNKINYACAGELGKMEETYDWSSAPFLDLPVYFLDFGYFYDFYFFYFFGGDLSLLLDLDLSDFPSSTSFFLLFELFYAIWLFAWYD